MASGRLSFSLFTSPHHHAPPRPPSYHTTLMYMRAAVRRRLHDDDDTTTRRSAGASDAPARPMRAIRANTDFAMPPHFNGRPARLHLSPKIPHYRRYERAVVLISMPPRLAGAQVPAADDDDDSQARALGDTPMAARDVCWPMSAARARRQAGEDAGTTPFARARSRRGRAFIDVRL